MKLSTILIFPCDADAAFHAAPLDLRGTLMSAAVERAAEVLTQTGAREVAIHQEGQDEPIAYLRRL